jgi:DNA primase
LRPSLLEELGLKSFCKTSGGTGLPGTHRSEYKTTQQMPGRFYFLSR